MTTLEKLIMEVLFKNSGGMKELELLVQSNLGILDMVEFEQALYGLQKNHKIAILTYTWHMSEEESAKREKRFIYTP